MSQQLSQKMATLLWNSVFKRFSRRCRHGVWQVLHAGRIHLPDLQATLIGSTVNRAHPCAAGGNAEAEALGCPRGGFGAKVHAIIDALGYPLDFTLTGGQASDIGQADTLLVPTPEGVEAFVGNKGYDCDALVEARGMETVIAPRANRTESARMRLVRLQEAPSGRMLLPADFLKV